MASFVSMTGGKVKLAKEDGAVIEVISSQLSDADQRFLESLRR
jgi:hypothetical protein